MTILIQFETASLADCLRKAVLVAPKKGQAFDKASGIIFEFDPGDPGSLVIKATDLEIFYTEWLDVLDMSGPTGLTQWRFNSQLIASVIASLPIGSGASCQFEQKDTEKIITVSQGRTKAKFHLAATEYYPNWNAFDPTGLTPVVGLGGRMSQVDWATDKAVDLLCGVHLNGTEIIATDRYRLARAPLEVPSLQNPITLPSGIIPSLIKKTGEVLIGGTSNQFWIMPDEHTQIRSVIYAGDYPNTSKIMKREKPNTIEFTKVSLLALINRALNFIGSDRFPTLRMFIGQEEVRVMISNEEMGMLGDVLELPGQCEHDFFELKFTPKNLTDAIDHAPNDKVKFGYNPANPKEVVYIEGGSGYECWVVPRVMPLGSGS